MRAKTNYAAQPEAVEIVPGNAGQSLIMFRENIEEVTDGDGNVTYKADEYVLTVPTTTDIEARVAANQEAWLTRAKDADYEAVADEVRAERGRLLAASDWTQMPDGALTPEEKAAWAVYRQALRDIPEQAGFPYDVSFPVKPE